jgi:leucyl/phenylalanyl-tRNA--protein transferase
MELNEFKISRSLRKSMKKFEYKFDTNFCEVIRRCGSKERKDQYGSSWIQDEIIEAFQELHAMGIAHSIESYKDGKLVGGLYGLAIGGVFCGESMFADVSDASKAAYAILIAHLKEWGYDFVDCQVPTQHLKSLGAKEMPRDKFLKRLSCVNMDILEHNWDINNFKVI